MTVARAVFGVVIGFSGARYALDESAWSLSVLIVACTFWLAEFIDAGRYPRV